MQTLQKPFRWDYEVPHVYTHAKRSHTHVKHHRFCSPWQSSVDCGNTKITWHALNVSVFVTLKLDAIRKKKKGLHSLHQPFSTSHGFTPAPWDFLSPCLRLGEVSHGDKGFVLIENRSVYNMYWNIQRRTAKVRATYSVDVKENKHHCLLLFFCFVFDLVNPVRKEKKDKKSNKK